MIDIKLNLPYLGERSEAEKYPVFFWREEHISPYRPDYDSFKASKYNSEEKCVSVLIGINQVNELFNAFNLKRNLSFYPNHLNFKDLICDIKKKIRDGIDSGGLDTFMRGDNIKFNEAQIFKELENREPGLNFSEHEYHAHHPFSKDNIQINSISFVIWAKENSFPIPKELKLYKDEKGNLKWESEILEDIFSAAGPEVEILYKEIKDNLRGKKKNVDHATVDLGVSCFKKRFYNYLTINDIENSSEGFGTEKPSRDIKGRILFEVAKRRIHDWQPVSHYQKFEELYRKYKNRI